ncbi:MAG: SRPBCC family protein [Candidatus Omnitrophota bacterium]|jgi:predicted amino acid dehydrogenase/ribosome-associated toxin RatA of RatAB toxin-antitoxin module
MPDNEIITITVSRIIPAEKWRIIRLVTKVWIFPSFIPTVKKVDVIHKDHNKIITKWQIQVDSVPIKWTEEDTIDPDKDIIYFHAIDGDLPGFDGAWSFKDHPEGCEVTVIVHLKVDIPAIRNFAESYIRKMITMNFEAILEALERRLVSLKYHNHRLGYIEKVAGFGIIWHLYNFYHLEKALKKLNPEYKIPSREFLDKLYHLTPSFKLCDIKDFKSKSGDSVNGCLVVATFIPDMIEKDMWLIFSKVVKACKIAEKNGVGIVTIGGFSSITEELMGHEISKEVDVPVTTGNTFAAVTVIDSVLKAAELINLDLSGVKMTIIGGTGDLGSACARVFADKVSQLTITGRTKTKLHNLYSELAKKHKAKIAVSFDNKEAVKNADIVITAASASVSILDIDWFKPGAIVCDMGYPRNISPFSKQRDDILIFCGGLTKSPHPFLVPLDIGLPAENIIYGCFAEGIILSLEKNYNNYSCGKGNIFPDRIDEMRSLGKKHGFETADFYWGDKITDAALIEKVREAVSTKASVV